MKGFFLTNKHILCKKRYLIKNKIAKFLTSLLIFLASMPLLA